MYLIKAKKMAAMREKSNSSTEHVEHLSECIVRRGLTAYPSYTQIQQRIISYKNWPIALKQRPYELANAGFFYSGIGDQTICFSCGGGIKAWEENDDPWSEHACWFPTCSFVRLHKSSEFIQMQKNRTSNSITNLTQSLQSVTTNDEADKQFSISVTNNCKICLNSEIALAFLPCGHAFSCVDCAHSFIKCAVCRQEIEASVKIFIS